MILKKYCFKIHSYKQAINAIQICKKEKIYPILFIEYKIISKFGMDWLVELIKLIVNDPKINNFKVFVDSKKNYGLFIDLVQKKINYIKIDANRIMYEKLSKIAKLNKVLINPPFSIVDLSKYKKDLVKLRSLLE